MGKGEKSVKDDSGGSDVNKRMTRNSQFIRSMVQDGKVVVQDVRGRYNAANQGRPFQRNNARGNGVAGNVGGQLHVNVQGQSDLDSDYFKDKMLNNASPESGASTG
ncbi:hypothetical protein Tco_0179588 [Tanacetum coccineum]